MRPPTRRKMRLAGIAAVTVFGLSACGFDGLNSMPIPGAQGTDEGSYQISAIIPNAGGLVTNAPVMIDDATVGSVGPITVQDWKARVTIRLDQGVRVARGSHVMVGMTSVLGSSHLAIVQPERPEGGWIGAGDQIPLTRCPEQNNITTDPSVPTVPDVNAAQQVEACTYPTTEQVLSSLSVVLNGGGLTQIGDIVDELNNMFTDRQDVIRRLVPRLNTLVSDLNDQRDNIIRAISGLDRLTAQINAQTPTVERALADGPRILQLLVDQRPKFTETLAALGKLSQTGNAIIDANEEDIKTIVGNLSPLLDQLQSTGPALTQSLGLLFTFPFVEEKIPDIVRGDYVNSDLVLDLTFDRLGKGIFSSVGLVNPEGVLGSPAGAAGRGLNPFTSPIQGGDDGARPYRAPDGNTPANPKVPAGGGN